MASRSKFWSKSVFANSGVPGGSTCKHLHLHLLTFHTAPSVPRSQVSNNLKDVSRDIFTVEGNVSSSSIEPF